MDDLVRRAREATRPQPGHVRITYENGDEVVLPYTWTPTILGVSV